MFFTFFFCSRDEKVSFSCHSHLSKSCFLVRCLLKGPINISIRPGFLTFCHLLLTTVRTPAYLQSRGNWWCRGVQCPTPICPKIERKLSWKKTLEFFVDPYIFLIFRRLWVEASKTTAVAITARYAHLERPFTIGALFL